jgi:hypothetical protein
MKTNLSSRLNSFGRVTLRALFVLMLLASTLGQSIPVRAAPGATPPEAPYWHCTPQSGGVNCQEDSKPTNTSTLTAYVADSNRGRVTHWEFVCSSTGACQDELNQLGAVYVRLNISVAFANAPEGSVKRLDVEIKAASNPVYGSPFDQHFYGACTEGTSGTCTLSQQVTIPISGFGSLDGWTPWIDVYMGVENGGGMTGTWNFTNAVTWQPTCNYTTKKVLENNVVIEPTIETPVGTPVDNQYVSDPALQVGVILRLIVMGGPWNDGTDDRYDTAVSFDGSTWETLDQITALCGVSDPVHPDLRTIYFLAPATDFYIRVNDTATDFADNTDVDEAEMRYSLAIVSNQNSCSQAYTTTDILASTLDIYPIVETPYGPNAVAPNQPDEMITDLLPQENSSTPYLYKLSITGDWNDGSIARDDYAYSFDGVTWDNVDNLPIVCEDETGIIFTSAETQFQIRVNDTPGDFANNAPTAAPYPTYSMWVVEQVAPLSCADKFTYDPEADTVASGVINANAQSGSIPETDLVVGEWYMLETVQGPWTNGDDSSTSYDIAVDIVDANINSQTEMSQWEYTDCSEYVDPQAQTNKRYFFQAPTTQINLWVADPAFTFANNTDQISYLLVHVLSANVTYWPSACERKFKIGNQLFQHEIPASAVNGMYLEPVDAETFANNLIPEQNTVPPILSTHFQNNQWYVLETILGPWKNEGVENRWDMDIRLGSSENFEKFSEWSQAECIVPTDKIGHYRVYFQTPPGNADILKYLMRVSDGNDANAYVNNTDQMTVKASMVTMAQVVPPGTPPAHETCGGSYSMGEQRGTVPVPPQNAAGVYVPSITVKEIYALQTFQYWEEGTASGNLTLPQISDDNGATWYDWQDYPAGLCYELVTIGPGNRDEWRLYFMADPGRTYKVRADDQDGNFGNNVNHDFSINVYAAQLLVDPFNTCTDAYRMVAVPLGQMADLIPGFYKAGITVPTVKGYTYAIQIYKGAWQENATSADRYDAALSMDSGVTFKPFSDRSIPGYQCYASIGNYEWIYFTAGDSYTKVRVNDLEAANWDDNDGSLYMRFFVANNVGDPNNPFDDPNDAPAGYLPSSYTFGCYSSAVRPAPFRLDPPPDLSLESITDFTGFANLIGSGISYVITSFVQLLAGGTYYILDYAVYLVTSSVNFFLWCPEHSAAINGILANAMTLEPMHTLSTISAMTKEGQAQINSYQWSYDTSPSDPFTSEGGGPDHAVDLIAPNLTDTPFAPGGSIEWRPVGGGAPGDLTTCNAKVSVKWGSTSYMSKGFCFVLNILKITNLNVYLNWAIVLACIIVGIRYIMKRWIGTFTSLITGANSKD